MNIAKEGIGNALTSKDKNHVIAVANDIYDETLGKYQSEINAEVGQGDGVYDISAANPTNWNPTPYGDLQEALTAFTDTTKKKGGMTIKYIDSNSGKYVQYRYVGTSIEDNDFNLEDNWISDESSSDITERTVDFTNVIEGDEDIQVVNLYINGNTNNWETLYGNSHCYIVKINPSDVKIKVLSNSGYNTYIAFLASNNITANAAVIYAGDSSLVTLNKNEYRVIDIPDGTNYLYVNKNTASTTDHTPQSLTIQTSNIKETLANFEERVDAKFDDLYVESTPNLNDYKIDGKYVSTIGGTTAITTHQNASMYIIPCAGVSNIFVTGGDYQNNNNIITYITFISAYSLEGNTVTPVGNTIKINSYVSEEIEVPEGARYIVLGRIYTSTTDHTPREFKTRKLRGIPEQQDIDIEKINETRKILMENIFKSSSEFDLSPYLEDGKYINANVWSDGNGKANCYLVPVNEGDVFFIKSPRANDQQQTVLRVYYAFLEDNTTVDSPSFVEGTSIFTYADADNYKEIIIPSGTKYLYINKNTISISDHTPDPILGVSSTSAFDKTALTLGTFNSSYNEIDTTPIREKFCGLIKGKGAIETFLFFTDPHLTDYSRYENMDEFVRDKFVSALQKYYNSLPLDYCICGGDWLNLTHTDIEARAFLGYCDGYMRKLFKNYYPTLGNHDMNPYPYPNTSVPTKLTHVEDAITSYQDITNLMFRENGGTYYSFNGINTKFYVLNNGVSFIKEITTPTYESFTSLSSAAIGVINGLIGNRQEQLTWLANALLTDNSPHIILVSHIYSNATKESEWNSNEIGVWAKGTHELSKKARELCIAYNNRNNNYAVNGTFYDFSSRTGHVDLYITGHTHFDYVDTGMEIPVISVTNLEGGYFDGNTYKRALIPTFDSCLADYDNSKFYMVRVGQGVNRIVNLAVNNVVQGNTLELTSELSGTITWTSRNTSIATVSNGMVTGVASGVVGIVAKSDDGTEEYYIVKVSLI